MRILSGSCCFSHRPFQGQGVSLYAGRKAVRYRNLRVVGQRVTPLRNVSWNKSARVAFTAATSGEVEIEYTLPAALLSQTVAFDVRHFKDDVENLIEAPELVDLNGSGAVVTTFDGAAILLAAEIRSGGTVRFRWRYEIIRGTPYQFRWQRVSGPSSPADVTTLYVGAGVYEADFTGLSTGTYVFRLKAEDSGATVVRTLLSSVSVQPDNTGPPAVTGLTLEAR